MFRSIVVGTDGSPAADGAVRKAAELARMCEAKLHIVSAYRTGADTAMGVAAAHGMMVPSTTTDTQMAEAVERHLRDLATSIEAEGVATSTYAVPGAAANAILDVAEAQGADLVVVGNQGMHGARRVLGSVPNNVTHHAGCTVMVVSTC